MDVRTIRDSITVPAESAGSPVVLLPQALPSAPVVLGAHVLLSFVLSSALVLPVVDPGALVLPVVVPGALVLVVVPFVTVVVKVTLASCKVATGWTVPAECMCTSCGFMFRSRRVLTAHMTEVTLIAPITSASPPVLTNFLPLLSNVTKCVLELAFLT